MRPKMAYFSDVDLATLDRSRLNERIQYKLSLFNRQQQKHLTPIFKLSNQQHNHSKKSNETCYHRNHQQVAGEHRNNYASKELFGVNDKTSLVPIKHSNGSIKQNQLKINNCDDDDVITDRNCNENIVMKQTAQNMNHNNNNKTLEITKHLNDIDNNNECNRTTKLPNSKLCANNKQIQNNESLIIDQECLDQRCVTDATRQRSIGCELSVPHRKRSGTWP